MPHDLNNWHMLPKPIPKQLKPGTGIQEHESKGILSHILKLLKPRKKNFRRNPFFMNQMLLVLPKNGKR